MRIGGQPQKVNQRGPRLLALVSKEHRSSCTPAGVKFLGDRQQTTHRMLPPWQSHGPFVTGKNPPSETSLIVPSGNVESESRPFRERLP